MKALTVYLCLLGLSTALLRAEEKDPAAKLAALQKRLEESKAGYVEKYRAFRPAFEELAREHEGDEAALTAHLWLLRQTWWQRQDGTMEEAAQAIVDHVVATYPDSRQLARIGEYRYVLASEKRREVFERIRKLTPHDEVRAAMIYAMAQEQGAPDRRELLEALVEKYGKVRYRETTYGDVADAHLHPHPQEALAVGKLAPEIVGADVDGKRFKLSEYRGKVVVLDFWGHW